MAPGTHLPVAPDPSSFPWPPDLQLLQPTSPPVTELHSNPSLSYFLHFAKTEGSLPSVPSSFQRGRTVPFGVPPGPIQPPASSSRPLVSPYSHLLWAQTPATGRPRPKQGSSERAPEQHWLAQRRVQGSTEGQSHTRILWSGKRRQGGWQGL